MNLVVIETATPACALALASGEEIFEFVGGELRHTEVLVPELARLLERAAITARDLDRIVVDRGPGLFTGLRVGLASAVGLALATGAGLVGVTSLELLAHGAQRGGVRGRVVAGVDGRRGEVFAQTFEVNDDNLRALDEPAVVHSSDIASRWPDASPTTFTGDGVTRYLESFRALTDAAFFDQGVPPAREGVELGRRREPTNDVTPLYLRDPDAVANFSTRDDSR